MWIHVTKDTKWFFVFIVTLIIALVIALIYQRVSLPPRDEDKETQQLMQSRINWVNRNLKYFQDSHTGTCYAIIVFPTGSFESPTAIPCASIPAELLMHPQAELSNP